MGSPYICKWPHSINSKVNTSFFHGKKILIKAECYLLKCAMAPLQDSCLFPPEHEQLNRDSVDQTNYFSHKMNENWGTVILNKPVSSPHNYTGN